MQGRRLADTPLNRFPIDYEDLQPGDYWCCLTVDGDRELNVRDHPEDRKFWGPLVDDPRWAGNLTGQVWAVIDPTGRYGMLSIHTVREEDDGTISVRPGDGSSNSIKIIGGREHSEPWHGYIEHGEWRSV